MKRTFLLIAILMLTGNAVSLYVGTAPGVKDLGTVERGESREVKVYITTNIGDNFLLNPSFERPQSTIFRPDDSRRYDFEPDKASQEDISTWVDFRQEVFQIDPRTEKIVSLENGGATATQGEVVFDLKVPEDAEPGYRAGAVNLNPQLSSGGRGTAVQTLGVTQFVFVFRVPGEARREVTIERVNGFRTADDRARVDFILRNEGTVTTRISRAETKVYNEFGNLSGVVVTGGEYLKPGETKVVSAFWNNPDLSPGEYRVSGQMNYITGQAFLDETIDISDYIQIRNASGEGGATEGEGSSSLMLIVMVLVVLAALMYYLEISPVAIIASIGLLGIAAYILSSGLSPALLGIPLIVAAAGLYIWYR